MLSWLLHHRKQIFVFFLRLLVPATNTDYAANCPSNGNTQLKTSEQHVSANDGFCQSQAGAPCRHKETCWEIELWSNTGNRKYSCAAAKESQEIRMCRNKGIPATSLIGVCHCNATVKGTNAEAREKKVAWNAKASEATPHSRRHHIPDRSADGWTCSETSIFTWRELRRREDVFIVFYMIFCYDLHTEKTIYYFIQNKVMFLE